jgi:long-chain fatty acid transport protein
LLFGKNQIIDIIAKWKKWSFSNYLANYPRNLKLKSLIMRKLLTFFAGTLITGSVLAGGLVTNTNQSAMFTRLQNRNASTGIDAVYYNPAGLTRLGDGFYVSINNQTISQTKTVGNNYPFLTGTPVKYIGKVSAPLFPGVYVAFKTGKLAFSAGFNPIGGGGGAKYDKGLPSFEMGIADLKPLLTGMGLTTTQYTADIFFEGTSVYFGYQANVSYAFSDMISAAVGARMVSAKNTYNGYIKNIMINPFFLGNPTSALIAAPGFFTSIGQPAYATMTADREVDVEQSGSGITPILSVNVAASEKLDIALRYEFQTKLELTTKVKNNMGGGIFIDGTKVIADMPAMLAVGVEYKPVDKLMVSASMNYYFDKNVDYDGSETLNVNMIDKNFIEYGLGLEYGLSEKLRASAGWVATSTGVNLNYQNDQEFSTNTNSFGAGIGYRITPMIDLNLGGQYTFYKEGSKDYTHMLGTTPITVTETYNKKTWLVAVGLDFYFGK